MKGSGKVHHNTRCPGEDEETGSPCQGTLTLAEYNRSDPPTGEPRRVYSCSIDSVEHVFQRGGHGCSR